MRKTLFLSTILFALIACSTEKVNGPENPSLTTSTTVSTSSAGGAGGVGGMGGSGGEISSANAGGAGGSAIPTCGNGLIDPGEDCDGATENSNNGVCLENCTTASCGDGHVCNDSTCWEYTEQCDDGNDIDNDECSNICEENGSGGQGGE